MVCVDVCILGNPRSIDYSILLLMIGNEGGKRANTLQKVNVPILANTECQQWYKDEKKSLVIVDTAICAGLENGGKDSCQVLKFQSTIISQCNENSICRVTAAVH